VSWNPSVPSPIPFVYTFHQSAVESACLHHSVRWLPVPTTCGATHQAGVSARYSGVQIATIMPFSSVVCGK
jgi:hypothetical protein